MAAVIVWGILVSSIIAKANEPSTLKVDGRAREYRVYVPKAASATNGYPVILLLHGGGGNMDHVDEASDFRLWQKREKFLLVTPEGVGSDKLGQHMGTWNAGCCCGVAMKDKIDDVKFISMLIDQLGRDYKIDPKRIYATGISNGGMMAYRLACELSEKIAAIAPVAAAPMISPCLPKRKVPVLHLHGKKDPCVPYGGGEGGGCWERFLAKVSGIHLPETHWPSPSVEKTVDDWRVLNQLSESAQVTFEKGDAKCTTYGGENNVATVTLCTSESNGHAWPGGGHGPICRIPFARRCKVYREIVGAADPSLPATRLVVEFFKKHSLP
jgi:polyhydroxybutyrate depolymerase